MNSAGRAVTVAFHSGRPDALAAAAQFVRGMNAHQITCLVKGELLAQLRAATAPEAVGECTDATGRESELVVVFGGDGSILRAAEWALALDIPLLGVNLGHIGFLAELESHETAILIEHVVNRAYTVEERMTIDVVVRADRDGEPVWRSFAVNEVSVEKIARERMIEVLVRVDDRPLSRWRTDGALVATPTGSTAYAFSANGPVLWPDLSALLIVPLCAHALFNRPLVISPQSSVSLEIMPVGENHAVVWCDGHRTFDVSGGMIVDVTAGRHPLRLARMTEQPFVDRLVRKFGLPVEGWRSATGRPHAQ